MKILILGGTIFVGRHITEAALKNCHEVTLFHRGQRGAELFAGQVERIVGDRDGGLEALAGRKWDAVIDTCGYVPRIVEASAKFLKDAAERYLFISTISVYDSKGLVRVDEASPLARMADNTTEIVDSDTYGPLKVLCEEAVKGVWGENSVIVRPGIVVGPHDPTDRFTYWVLRMNRGGRVLVPDQKDQPVQFIDGRDLSSFCLGLLESRVGGTFNATGPNQPYRLGDLMERVRDTANPSAELAWIPTDVLQGQEVKHWQDLPLCLEPDPAEWTLFNVDASRAIQAGLSFRSLEETVRDTLAWALAREDAPLKVGISQEAEQSALAAV